MIVAVGPSEVWCAECARPTLVSLRISDAGYDVPLADYCEGHGLRKLRAMSAVVRAPIQYFLGWYDCPTCHGVGTDEGRRCRLCAEREEDLL